MVEVAFPRATGDLRSSHPSRLHRFLGEWQGIVLRLDARHPHAILPSAQDAVEALPHDLCVLDRLLVRTLVLQLVSRLIPLGSRERGVIERHVLTVLQDVGTSTWRADLLVLIGMCRQVNASGPTNGQSRIPALVQLTLRVLDQRSYDKHATSALIAALVRSSTKHLNRLLTRYTSRSISSHIHLRRTESAHQLLTHTQMPVKAVAAAVGYSDSRHLERHYKKRYGITPSATRVQTSRLSMA